jgi:hypothetical protein
MTRLQRLLLACAFLLGQWTIFAFTPTDVLARGGVRAPILTACPLGQPLLDGCGLSAILQHGQSALFQIGVAGPFSTLPNCWVSNGGVNQLSASTTAYTINPTTLASTGQGSNTVPYNSPGCEWAVGPWTPDAQLADPTNPGIPGCPYNATGGLSGSSATMLCGGSSVPHNISGYYFGQTANHPCIAIEFNGSGLTGDYVFQNNVFRNNGNCAYNNSNTSLLLTYDTQNVTVHILDNTFDGQGLVYSDFWGTACQPSPGVAGEACNVTSALSLAYNTGGNAGNIDIERNVFLNFMLRGIYFSNSCGASFIFKDNWVQGHNIRDEADHGEFFEGAGPATTSCAFPGGQYLGFSNIVEPTGMSVISQAPWPVNFSFPGINSIWNADHIVVIGAVSGGSIKSGTAPTITIAAGTSTMTFSGPSGWTVGSGLEVSSCTASGVAGSLQGNTWTPKSGQASAGPGGGWNSTTFPQSWGFDLDNTTGIVPYALTGFIDNGAGNGTPSGVAGNVLTVTVTGLVNLVADTAIGTTITGTGVTSTQVVAALNGATGGVGQYTVSGSAQNTGAAQTLDANVPNYFDGGWTAAVNITCSTVAPVVVSARMFLASSFIGVAAGPTPAGYSGPIQLTNNLIDEYAWGASYALAGWNQVGNGGTSVTPLTGVTYPVTGFIDNGAGGGSPSGVAGNTLTVTGANPTWFVYANSSHGATVGGSGVTTATITANGTGSGGTGTYTINGSAQLVNPAQTLNVEIAGCAGPAYFNGNMSLSGLYTYDFWNAWNAVIAGTHC